MELLLLVIQRFKNVGSEALWHLYLLLNVARDNDQRGLTENAVLLSFSPDGPER